MAKSLPDFYTASTRERFNWGYWQGRADLDRGKWPMWGKAGVYQCQHPFDAIYGQGYWAGRYENDLSVETSDAAWSQRKK